LKILQRNAGSVDDSLDDETVADQFHAPSRNLNSLQHQLVFKFIGLTNRYTRRSGEDREAYYNCVNLIFLKENEGEKSFDIVSAWNLIKWIATVN
jgi:hypothetical protein